MVKDLNFEFSIIQKIFEIFAKKKLVFLSEKKKVALVPLNFFRILLIYSVHKRLMERVRVIILEQLSVGQEISIKTELMILLSELMVLIAPKELPI